MSNFSPKMLFEITPEITHLAELCEESNAIDKELYGIYDVKRGLRDMHGKGVLAGLTNVSDDVCVLDRLCNRFDFCRWTGFHALNICFVNFIIAWGTNIRKYKEQKYGNFLRHRTFCCFCRYNLWRVRKEGERGIGH